MISKSELETTLYEVEACINARPLTYVDEDIEPLTPSHFLLGRNSPFDVSHVKTRTPQNASEFNVAHKNHLLALDEFWRIWSEDYIRNLPAVGHVRDRNKLQVGSLALIRKENTPRMKWPLGRVLVQ